MRTSIVTATRRYGARAVGIEIVQLDLSSQVSVRQFAENFTAKYDRLDVLANNAGIMWVPYGTTEDGYECQFGTNHLGHFALTGLLMDVLLQTPGSQVVNVISSGHRSGTIDIDNLMFNDGKVKTLVKVSVKGERSKVIQTI
jgi:NAD(P)-dependent dehydrogenase (short-subunit alcohol dehydrogenase family)